MKRVLIIILTLISICSFTFLAGCGEENANKEIVSIEVVDIPVEGVFLGAFNDADIKLLVKYSNNSEETLNVVEEMLPESGRTLINTVGTHQINLVYKGINVNFSITIIENEFLITFMNLNGEVVKESIYYANLGIPVEEPTAEEMAILGYRFLGTYDKDFSNPTEDMTVIGQYVKTWAVKFYNAEMETVSEQIIDQGSSAIEPTEEDMFVEGYRFLGTYDKEFDEVMSDMEINGQYVKTWIVRFYNGNNEIISEQIVDDGLGAIEPTDYMMENVCSLILWDKEFSVVKKDLDVYGLFSNHIESGWIIEEDATCIESGYKYKECILCHERIAESEIPAKGHNYQSILVRQARCDQNGEIKYICECGDQYSITTYAEHFMKVEERVEATCTQDGYIRYGCDNCDVEDYLEIMPQGHDYQIETLENKIVYTCTRCNYSYEEITEEIEASGNVLLIQDRIPWDIDNGVALLNRLQRDGRINGWSITTTTNFNQVDLSKYQVIYIANDQKTATYNRLGELNEELTAYAERGGIIVYGACDHGWAGGNISYDLVGNVTRSTYYSRYNYIIDEDHPVVTGAYTDGVGIGNYLLEGTYCSHSAFIESTLPMGYNAILQDSRGMPTLVEYGIGNGYVIASGLTWEFYYTRSFKGDTTYSKNVYDDLIVYALSLANLCDHELEEIETVAPTCSTKGYTVYNCKVCGQIVYGNYIDTTPHSVVFVEGVDRTCLSDGIIAHYRCTVCSKIFREQACINELASAKIDAGHELIRIRKYDTTHHWDENACEKCSYTSIEYKREHSFSSWSVITDEQTGEYKEKRNCSCGYVEYRELLKGTITGRVYGTRVNGSSLLSGAQVVIEGVYGIKTATTDFNGVYTFNDLYYGNYTVQVTKTGYISATQTCRINMATMQNDDIYLVLDESQNPGTASGSAKDAQTGNGISGITIYVRSGYGNTSGTVLQTLTTNSNGEYTTQGLMAGNYTFEFVDNRGYATKYGKTSINVAIIAGENLINKDASLINIGEMHATTMRIVLTWGSSPSDLDSHLYIDRNKDGSDDYHIYYQSKNVQEGMLDLDDISSYGPETVTIDLRQNTFYTYVVHNYSNGGNSVLSNSGATVKVYLGQEGEPVYTFNVPSGSGRYWSVFSYDSDTGIFTIHNNVGQEILLNTPLAYCA